ncbi:MAG: RluA family pseudouridine synthase [Treponema sp.]|jgi:23S rRNA pseudouridine955/2504/2580 synthase|nr:RluA family pseudouridine synthase [Treponema sp.]
MELKAGPNDAGRRLDRVLRKSLPDYSLSLIHRLLRQGKVAVNGIPAHPDDRVTAMSIIRLEANAASSVNHIKPRINKNADSNVNCRPGRVYRDGLLVNCRCQRINKEGGSVLLPEILMREAGIIIFNKPPGLASHGKDSLDALVKNWLADKIPPSLSFKPGPLHRLDRPSSGIIAFSESLEGARWFSRLLRERKVVKTYLAIAEGHIAGDELWRDDLVRNKNAQKTLAGNKTEKSKNAITTVKPLASNGSCTLIEARIITGRTHQIRAQAASHGHPLAGDRKYGALPFPGGFCLHAWKMELCEQIEGFPQPLTAPLPEAFLTRIQTLFHTTKSQNN